MSTYAPTKQGDTLAWQLAEWIGYSATTRSICAGLVRNANRLHNLSVADCNGHPIRERMTADSPAWMLAMAEAYEAKVTADIDTVSARIESLAFALPFPDETGAPWPVEVQGDPRGCVVGLTTPTGSRIVVERGRNLA